jgi:RNA polymerase sigma-70 factor (ECF subfamily)
MAAACANAQHREGSPEPRGAARRLADVVTERGATGRYLGTFDELFGEHSAAVLAYAARRTTNIADAEDIVAETFVTAWRRFGDTPAKPRAWLYGIARRVLANQRRGADRRASLLQRLAAFATRAPSATSSDEPALDALAYLRPDDQEILKLVAWEDLTHTEIAEVLGISVNAVAIRLHRARQRFAATFARSARDELKDPRASRTHRGQWMERPTPAHKETRR